MTKPASTISLLALVLGCGTPAAPPEPASRIAITAVSGGSVKPIGQMAYEQKRWFDELQRRLTNCEPPMGAAAATFSVTVTFTADAPTVDASGVPDALRGCVARMFASATPHAGALVDFNVPITFLVKTRG